MSKTKQELLDLAGISILYQYLYLDPKHTIRFKNSIDVPMEIRMDDNKQILIRNLNFPESEEMLFAHQDVPNMLALIDQLKDTPAVEYPNAFDSRWEEIKMIATANVSLNREHQISA